MGKCQEWQDLENNFIHLGRRAAKIFKEDNKRISELERQLARSEKTRVDAENDLRDGYHRRFNEFKQQLAEAQAKLRATENAYIEMGAMVEWIEKALNGEQVSDFAESYPLVRAVVDMQAKLRESVPFETACLHCEYHEWDGGGCSCSKSGMRDFEITIDNCPLKEGV